LKLRKRVLEVVLSKVKFSVKAHLEFRNGDRRKLRGGGEPLDTAYSHIPA
jgi:hypothetical protein